MADLFLDAKGLQCPLPVLRARKILKGAEPGDILTVEASDHNAPKDFTAFCEAAGYALLSSTQGDGLYRFVIRRTG